MIIDPKSVSYESVKKDLEAFLAGKPDFDKWKDFFDSGAGTTIIELIAGLSTYLQFLIIANRRECYLSHAQLNSSVIAMSEYLGYSTFRGRNSTMTLNITPNQDITINKFDVVGTVKDVSIIALETKTLLNGVPDTLDIVIGTVKTEVLVVPSPVLQIFRYTSDLVSDDILLLLNSVEVPTSSSLLDLANDKYAVLSNATGGIDTSYLQEGIYLYDSGDSLELQYVERKNTAFEDANLLFDYGTINTVSDKIAYKDIESNDSAKINGPLSHETLSVIKGRDDYLKQFKLLDAGIADTNARDVSSAVVELTYVKIDQTLFSAGEKTALLNELLSHRTFGVEPPSDITDPVQVNFELDVTLYLSDPSTDINTINTDIAAILDSYENQLGSQLDFFAIEEQLEELSYVQVARLVNKANAWVGSTAYLRGAFVIPSVTNGFVYECTTAGTTDVGEPVFPTVVGNTVVDGGVTWTCRNPSNQPAVMGWNEYYLMSFNYIPGV